MHLVHDVRRKEKQDHEHKHCSSPGRNAFNSQKGQTRGETKTGPAEGERERERGLKGRNESGGGDSSGSNLHMYDRQAE